MVECAYAITLPTVEPEQDGVVRREDDLEVALQRLEVARADVVSRTKEAEEAAGEAKELKEALDESRNATSSREENVRAAEEAIKVGRSVGRSFEACHV